MATICNINSNLLYKIQQWLQYHSVKFKWYGKKLIETGFCFIGVIVVVLFGGGAVINGIIKINWNH